MIAIIDYGMGNLRSAQKAFEWLGADARITNDINDIADASHIVLPGVGAFRDAQARLKQSGLFEILQKEAGRGKPFLGICLGMQLMHEYSEEGGLYTGLGLVRGGITLLNAPDNKIPHVGWNSVHSTRNCPLLQGVDGEDFYFVHSYCAADTPDMAGATDYNGSFASVVWDGKYAFGTQFHPEKSGDAGLRLIANFLRIRGGADA